MTCPGPSPPTEWHHHAEAQRPEAPRPWGEALEPHGPDVYWVSLSLCRDGGYRLQGRCVGIRVRGRAGQWISWESRPVANLEARGTWKFFLADCDPFKNELATGSDACFTCTVPFHAPPTQEQVSLLAPLREGEVEAQGGLERCPRSLSQ